MIRLGELTGVRAVLGARFCWRKTQFASQGAADAAVRSLRKRGLTQDVKGRLRSYHCPVCSQWHTGHTKREED